MGIPTRNKMYKYPSVPAMGSKASAVTSAFKALGKVFKSAGAATEDDDYRGPQFESRDPNQVRVPEVRTREDVMANKRYYNSTQRKTNPLLSKPGMSTRRRHSIPAMGPGGAAIGGYLGKKLGSWVGSAGKLIGKKHEKYGRQAGEYIGGTLGAGIGLAGVPF
jgi:hypothetical protein